MKQYLHYHFLFAVDDCLLGGSLMSEFLDVEVFKILWYSSWNSSFFITFKF